MEVQFSENSDIRQIRDHNSYITQKEPVCVCSQSYSVAVFAFILPKHTMYLRVRSLSQRACSFANPAPMASIVPELSSQRVSLVTRLSHLATCWTSCQIKDNKFQRRVWGKYSLSEEALRTALIW